MNCVSLQSKIFNCRSYGRSRRVQGFVYVRWGNNDAAADVCMEEKSVGNRELSVRRTPKQNIGQMIQSSQNPKVNINTERCDLHSSQWPVCTLESEAKKRKQRKVKTYDLIIDKFDGLCCSAKMRLRLHIVLHVICEQTSLTTEINQFDMKLWFNALINQKIPAHLKLALTWNWNGKKPLLKLSSKSIKLYFNQVFFVNWFEMQTCFQNPFRFEMHWKCGVKLVTSRLVAPPCQAIQKC